MIQLIATDIDGTLLDENRDISYKTALVFKNIALPKVLISARMPQAMYYLQDALGILGSPIVCYNGALVMHEKHIIHNESIPFVTVKELASIGNAHGLHVSFYRGTEWFVSQNDQWTAKEVNNTRTEPTVKSMEDTLEYFEQTQHDGGAHKVMFMGDVDKMDLAFAKAQQHHTSQVHLYRSKGTYTEISPKGISKESALAILLRNNFPEISMSQVAAFGDNYNDTDMLAGVGYGVAVENARDEVKQAAAYITLHHKKDGVASWLEQHILNKKATL